MFQTLVLVAAALVGQADAAKPDEDLKLEVLRLVRRLDSRELAAREAAERDLIEIGPKALPLLPPLDERTPAEVKERLDRIKILLQKQQAQTAAVQSTVTLSGKRMPLTEIFQAVAGQTGNPIRFGQGPAAPETPQVRLDVDYKAAPFWPTFDELLDRAGLTVDPYGLERTLSVNMAPEGMLPRSQGTSYNGPFRFQAVRIDATRDLRMEDVRSTALTIEIAWEPRFHPISMQQRMSEIQIADETGEPVIVAAAGAELEIPVLAEAISTELRIPLQAPPRSVQKIATLKGTMHALMQGQAETFVFSDLEKADNVEKRAAGVTVILEKARKNRDVWELRVLTRFDDAQGALASHRNWVFDNPARLVAPDGTEIPFHAYDSTRQMENEVGVAYFFGIDGGLEGYKFVYESAGTVLTASFDYELKDLVLP
ncbi:MAG: hypothetical protein ACYC6Y_26935 [Thermoguttaceae bacterium]